MRARQSDRDASVAGGRHIRGLREAKKLSLADVAQLADCPVSTLFTIEARGLANASLLRGLSTALDSSPNDLVGWDRPISTKEVWAFNKAIQGYWMDMVEKSVTIEPDGSSWITQTVTGLYNYTGAILKLRHSVHWSLVEPNQPGTGLQDGLEFNWRQNPGGGPLPGEIGLLREEATAQKGRIEVRVKPSETPSGYEFRYRCVGGFRMTAEAPEAVFEGESFPKGLEWSQFYVDKPIRKLQVTIKFPENYVPVLPQYQIWKRDFLYSPDREAASGLLTLNGHLTPQSATINGNLYKFTVDYPVYGYSYGLVWRPMAIKDFGAVFPGQAERERVQLADAG